MIPSPWTILASLLGYLLWKLLRYLQRLLGQPPLVYEIPSTEEEESERKREVHGLMVAVADLDGCTERRWLPSGREVLVLCAGIRNFREPWARDFSFASFGLLELGEDRLVREGLEVFLLHQRPTGQFPVKVHSTGVVDRYLHSLFGRQQPIHSPLRPKYITAHSTISLDGNGLLVIAATSYLRSTGDQRFLQLHWPALQRAVAWMEEHVRTEDGLLSQGPYTDWADTVARTGRILYTNVVYWKALHDLAWAAEWCGNPGEAELYAAKAEHLRRAVQEHFWSDARGYFLTSERHAMLNSDGNLLAVAWGLADRDQAWSILDRMAEHGMAHPVPTRVTSRPYPDEMVGLECHLAGIACYHTEAAWLWLGAWHVIAQARSGRVEEARALLQRIDEVIIRDRIVYEVHGPDGRHLSTPWYTSEAPLTWNAGMIVHAHHELRRTGCT